MEVLQSLSLFTAALNTFNPRLKISLRSFLIIIGHHLPMSEKFSRRWSSDVLRTCRLSAQMNSISQPTSPL